MIDTKIVLPIYMQLPIKYKKILKKKDDWLYTVPINFNEQRQMSRFTYPRIKIAFTEHVKEQVEWLKLKSPISITYNLYYRNKSSDLNNWVSVVDKFFADTLQKAWCIEDDNVLHVVQSVHNVIEQDTKNPRIEVHIQEDFKL